MPRVSPKRPVLEVAVKEDAGFDNLAEMLKRVGGRLGCDGCGFIGFDFLRGEDILQGRPIAGAKLKKIEPYIQGFDGIADVRIR